MKGMYSISDDVIDTRNDSSVASALYSSKVGRKFSFAGNTPTDTGYAAIENASAINERG